MMPDTLTIRDQTFHVVPWSLRIAAKVLDAVCCYGLAFFGIPVLYAVLPIEAATPLAVVLLAVSMWWWLASDGVLHGAGLGKRLLGLKLVHRRHGSAPSWSQAALRQLKYSMFLSAWGLLAHSYDESHNRSQGDEYVTVKADKPIGSNSVAAPEASPPPLPRPIDSDGLASFLSAKYSRAERTSSKDES